MNDGSRLLTIVIPMYRQLYIEELLSDLSIQSDHNFNLIISSDGPIEDFTHRVKALIHVLKATVIENIDILGREDPSLSWERAVSQAPVGWIWLLGDDDRIESGCVEAFNKLSPGTLSNVHVCRFPVAILAQDGTKISKSAAVSRNIEPRYFLKSRLLGHELSFASEYVFQKERLEEIGGFVHFPFAWCSDDATWLQLSYPNGIFQLAGDAARVYWRDSSANTSSKVRQSPLIFASAEQSFINWAINESFLAGSLSSIRWKLRFAWWFAQKATQKNLEPRVYWKQISKVANDLKLSKLVMSIVASLFMTKFMLWQLVKTRRGR